MLYYQVLFCMCWVLFICKGSTNYRKYNQSEQRITQQKGHLLIWNSETTQNLNIYLHNYQTETAIFLATKHEKTIMVCSYLNFPIQKIPTVKWGDFDNCRYFINTNTLPSYSSIFRLTSLIFREKAQKKIFPLVLAAV